MLDIEVIEPGQEDASTLSTRQNMAPPIGFPSLDKLPIIDRLAVQRNNQAKIQESPSTACITSKKEVGNGLTFLSVDDYNQWRDWLNDGKRRC